MIIYPPSHKPETQVVVLDLHFGSILRIFLNADRFVFFLRLILCVAYMFVSRCCKVGCHAIDCLHGPVFKMTSYLFPLADAHTLLSVKRIIAAQTRGVVEENENR